MNRLSPLPKDQLSPRLRRFKNEKRLILCCDGGGVRGILTLQALKALEEHAGARCIDIFDMFAGTSTGSIIAGALAWGVSVDDLIQLYREKYREIFSRTIVGSGVIPALAAGILLLALHRPWGAIGAAVLAYLVSTLILVPKYRSHPLRCLLKSLFGEDTLAHCHRDVLITGKDTLRSETTYFTAFHPAPMPSHPSELSRWLEQTRGTYRDVRLRDAIAASAASAPTYFRAFGRFIDGGVGSYNNVSYAAPVEALRYSARPVVHKMLNDQGEDDPNGRWPVYTYPREDQLYRDGQVIVLSFGTGKQINNMRPGQALKIRTSLRWVDWVIREGLDDADEQQSYVAHVELDRNCQAVVFRRFQLYFTPEGLSELREIDPTIPENVDCHELGLDAIRHFDFLDRAGQAFGKWLRRSPRPGELPRLELDQIVELGKPVQVKPSRFHISIYSQEVKEELKDPS